MRNRLIATTLAAMLLGSGPVAAEQVLHRGNAAEPESIDPHKSTGVSENVIQNDLFEGLVAFAADGSLIPGAAASWTVSDDGLVYTFTLRAEGKWSDGSPVTADDFVYSLRRAVDPATASDYAPILSPIVGADAITGGTEKAPETLGVKALAPNRLEIRLRASTPYFLGLLAHNIAFPVKQSVVEQFGQQWTRPGNIVGNGAFRLTEWVPQSQITAVPNELFHDRASVKLDTVVYYPLEDMAEELKRYRAGELDVTYDVPSDQIKRMAAERPDEFKNTPYFGTYFYVINLTREPLGSQLPIRRALSMALDRDVLTDKITQGGELPAYGFVPPGVPGYDAQAADYASMSQTDRTAEAKRLLAEAGYGPDNPLNVEILYNTNENHRKIAVAVAAMWKPLGVETTLTNQEWKVYLETRDQKQFELARAAWIGDYVDPSSFLDLFISTAGVRNDSGYDNKAYDEILATAAMTTDPAARFDLLERAEAMMLADQPLIPIYTYTSQHMVSPKVKGWEFNVLDIHPARWLSKAE
ncbi:peptide ABC transporter substrate-binding protein [Zavarzinia sp. CC-PAN008]|uniref:peptide ABC transporter substrate-binding protein n=1 Tax=Zavarzinia sp. CC-PAN008 TaxID=3243332 RepID=UPI003F74A1AF